MLRRSFETALSGRPGPVLLDIPMDIQRMDVPEDGLGRIVPSPGPDVDPAAIDDLMAALGRAERPLVLVGGGVRSARAAEPVRELLASLGVPVVNSLMGVDVVPASSDLRVGMIGSYGNRWANLAVGRCDFLLVLGSRLDIRQTGSETEAFRTGRTIVQVDCDPGEMNNRITGVTAILADLKTFAAAALPAARAATVPDRSGWLDEIRGLREEWPDTEEMIGSDGINPNVLMHQLSAVGGDAAVYVADVGQHQMWAAQSLQLRADQRFLTSGGLGSMGFGLPAAIGAAFGVAGRPVVLVAGDGGFQTNIQELQTVARNQLPLKMLIVNNRTHGMVRQFQQSYFDSRFQSTVWGYSAPDFAAVAAAYGIPSSAVGTPDGVEAGVSWLMSEPGPGAARGDGLARDERLPEARLRPADHRDGAVRHARRHGRHLAELDGGPAADDAAGEHRVAGPEQSFAKADGRDELLVQAIEVRDVVAPRTGLRRRPDLEAAEDLGDRLGDLGDGGRAVAAPDVVDVVSRLAQQEPEQDRGEVCRVAEGAAGAAVARERDRTALGGLADEIGHRERRPEILVRTGQREDARDPDVPVDGAETPLGLALGGGVGRARRHLVGARLDTSRGTRADRPAARRRRPRC